MVNNHRFRTKLEGHQTAKKVWTCRYDRTQHIGKKPEYCITCERSSFFYFASTGEANRFSELALMQDYGKIKDLNLQVPFPVKVNKIKIFEYRADFTYTLDTGIKIIEDFKGAAKGYEDPVFKLKQKIIEAVYQIKITITRQKS